MNGVVTSTKTFTFVGNPASVKAVANLKVLKAGGVAGTAIGQVYNGTATATDATTISGSTGRSPITAFLADANGNVADNNTYVVKAISSNTSVITTAICTSASTGADFVVGEYNCAVLGAAGAVSGTSATITFTLYKDSTLATVVATATPVTLTIGGAVVKTVLSTDAASYSALAPVVVTTTSTDSAGNAAYDQDVTTVGTIVS